MRQLARLLLHCQLLAMATSSLADQPAVSPRIVAHRGLLRHAPENTMANFRACLELRIGFELDVRRSKDGRLVCVHDEKVDRTTSGSGEVSELTLAELKTLDAGSWFALAFKGEQIPTLDEVLSAVSENEHDVLIALDLKAADVESDCVKLAKDHEVLNRVLFIGRTISMPSVRRTLKAADPKAPTAAVANDARELDAAITDEHSDFVYVRFVPTASETQRIRKAGKRIFIAGATVAGKEPDNWRKATASGVDAILTDYPLSLRAANQGCLETAKKIEGR